MNHHTVSSVSIVFSSLSTAVRLPAAAPSGGARASHATLRALLGDRAFVRSLRAQIAPHLVDSARIDALLDHCQRVALGSSTSPVKQAACKLWLRTLVRQQLQTDPQTWLPLPAAGLFAPPTRSGSPGPGGSRYAQVGG